MVYTKGFEFVESQSRQGGNDHAFFSGSVATPGRLSTAPGEAAFTCGVSYQHKVRDFKRQVANAVGDDDTAQIYGWPSQTDTRARNDESITAWLANDATGSRNKNGSPTFIDFGEMAPYPRYSRSPGSSILRSSVMHNPMKTKR